MTVASQGWGRAFPAQPGGGGGSEPQHLALDLPFPDDDAADFLKMDGGFLIAGFVGALQADEAGKRGGVGAFQAEDGVGGMVSLLLAGVVVKVAPHEDAAENALDHQRVAALAHFSRLGLVGGIDPIGGLLEELADELGGGLENGGAQQFFQIGDEGADGLGGAEGGDQLFDFFFPGEGKVPGVRRFFLTPALRSCRDSSETSSRCSSTSCLKRS